MGWLVGIVIFIILLMFLGKKNRNGGEVQTLKGGGVQNKMLREIQKLTKITVEEVLKEFENQKLKNNEQKRVSTIESSENSIQEDEYLLYYKTLITVAGFIESKITLEIQQHINKFCDSLHGICYFLILDVAMPKGFMNMRLAQALGMIDNELKIKGIKDIPLELKISYYKSFDLLDTYNSQPSLFKWN